MRNLLLLLSSSLGLLSTSVALGHPPSAAAFVEGVPFVVPVDAEWDESLARRPEATLQALQGVLKRALALGAKHVDATTANVFQWTGTPLPPKRRLRFVLTDLDRPILLGQRMPPATEGMIAMTATAAPADEPDALVVHVVLKIGKTALDKKGGLRKDAVAYTAAALGDSLFSAAAVYLPLTMRDLLREQVDPQTFYAREVAVARSALPYFQSILRDGSLSYADRVPAYWGLTAQRRKLEFGLRQRPQPQETTAVPFSLAFADRGGAVTDPPSWISALFNPILERAMRIVSDFPPDGAWNNAFTWDPTNKGAVAHQRIAMVLVNMPLEAIAGVTAELGAAALSPEDLWGGTDHLLVAEQGRSRVRQHWFQMLIQLRASVLDDRQKPRPDGLARLVAVLGGEIYGNVQPQLGIDAAPPPRDSATFMKDGARQDLRSRKAAIALMERYMASSDFEALPEAEKPTFPATVARLRCAAELLKAYVDAD